MAEKYGQLQLQAEELIARIEALTTGLNENACGKPSRFCNHAKQRTRRDVEIDYDIHDKHTRFTYSEMLSSIELYNGKGRFGDYAGKLDPRRSAARPPQGAPEPTPAIVVRVTKRPAAKQKVGEYKRWLQQGLYKLAGANDNDEIEVQE